MDINGLLQGVKCECGREHTCNIRYVYVERDAARRLPLVLKDFDSILLVADENTYAAAGELCEQYAAEKIKHRQIFTGAEVLVPNEDAISAVQAKLPGIDFILGIGSGVIQDLCKYISHFANIPYAVFATAPSMDGYASSGAAMITDGMKVTYPAGVPYALLADTRVIKDAPLEMIKAGYGDIIGKYSALNDWKLSALVNGEYLCPYIYSLTLDMLKAVLPLAKSLLERDEESIKLLMESLIAVGIAMAFAGSSRPASGSEHHLSHYYEITGILDGTGYLPHGIDVLYSTYTTACLREKIAATDFPKQEYRQSDEELRRELRRVYTTVADGCYALQQKVGNYKADRYPIYLERENEIKKILSECPSSERIKELILGIGLDLAEYTSLYGEEKINDAIKYAKDLKDRYSVLWLYYSLNPVLE